jgi:hypothetical protein
MLTVKFLQILLIASCCAIVERIRTSVAKHEETAHTYTHIVLLTFIINQQGRLLIIEISL